MRAAHGGLGQVVLFLVMVLFNVSSELLTAVAIAHSCCILDFIQLAHEG